MTTNRRGILLTLPAAVVAMLATFAPAEAQQSRRMSSVESLIVDLPPLPAAGMATANIANNDTEPVVNVRGGQVHQGNDAGYLIDDDELSQTMVSEQVAGLTLESLESIALSANPSIQRASAIVGAARARALQVGLRPNPEVGIDFQQLGSDGLAEQYGVLVRQEMVRSQKLDLNRSVALHRAAVLEQQLVAQRQRVLTDVRIAYVRALRAERQVTLSGQIAEIARQGVTVTQELLDAGEIGRADLLQAEIEVETAAILVRNAENMQLSVWQNLAAVTGQATLEVQPLAGDPADVDEELEFESALQDLRSRSPEVAAALSEIERARCNLKRQQIEVKPNVTVQGLINWRDNGIGGDPDGAISVSLPLPLWNKNQGGIREARYQLGAAQHALSQVELELKHRMAPVFERYRNAQEQAKRYEEKILPKAAETLELTRQTYELGEVSFINLLTVQRTFANTQLAHLDAQEELRIARAEIMGLLLSGSFGNAGAAAR
ncbi:MAG: TolC family protein [Rubripirellula sp.]